MAVLGQSGAVTGAVSHTAFLSQAQLFWFVSAHKNSKCRLAVLSCGCAELWLGALRAEGSALDVAVLPRGSADSALIQATELMGEKIHTRSLLFQAFLI